MSGKNKPTKQSNRTSGLSSWVMPIEIKFLWENTDKTYIYHGKRYCTFDPSECEHYGWNTNFVACEVIKITPKKISILSPDLGQLWLNREVLERDGKVYHSKPHAYFYKEKPAVDPEKPPTATEVKQRWMDKLGEIPFYFKGEVVIDGKTYLAEVIAGTRYINDLPIDEFIRTLPTETLKRFEVIGKEIMKGKTTEPQAKLSELEFLDY